MGGDLALIDRMEPPFRDWLAERIENGTYHGWLAVDSDGQVIGGAGLWLYDWIPSPLAPQPARGYILNVYTEPGQRRQGIARRLVEEILTYCRARGLKFVLLHASEQGRPIYEGLGFEQTNEMRIRL
ncbi:MAG: GNAT family N-acetyltransferase [Anaerolineae bacterium]|nr:GNAT family N-acetyltransferase [Anaerolineae bacterium]